MTEKIRNYTNRELDQFLDELNTKLDNNNTNQHSKLDEILEQVKLTNNRVRRLEIWKGYMTGGVAILTALVVPMVLLILNKII